MCTDTRLATNTLVRLYLLCSTHVSPMLTPHFVACDAYHLPEHISPHVDFVTPTVHFDTKILKRSGSSEGTARNVGQPGYGSHPKTTGEITTLLNQLETCDQQITPICLRALYGLVYEPLAAEKNSYGIGKLPTCA